MADFNKVINIYLLVDPRDNQPKYIGVTTNPSKRYWNHLNNYSNSLKGDWVRSLLRQGLKPSLEIIDTVDFDNWPFWEQHYISLFKSWGFTLKNMTVGGEGTIGRKLTEDHKNKISQRLKGRKISEEHKATLSKALKGRIFSDETLTKMSLSAKQNMTDERKKLQAEKMKGKPGPNKGRIFSEEVRMKMRKPKSQEHKLKLSLSRLGKKRGNYRKENK